jgi:glycosyltransferase involved in cell wall biosynthesis
MAKSDALRIALLGSRGIPGRYGGYETLMEELGCRLAERGVEVTVYCRSHYTPPSLREHRGVRLVVLPTLRTKYLDTPVHTLLSCAHAAIHRYDAALVVNGANALFVPILRGTGIPTALHVDGLEQERAKWGVFGRWVYRVSERLACWLPNRLVTDAATIERHYLERHRTPSTMIPYGVEPSPPAKEEWLARLGLERRGYFLYVSRFEPENNPHRVVDAYREVPGSVPLVMVGDAPYSRRFIEELRSSADPRVLFPGAIYGDGYRELLSQPLAYVHATSVGGTHPALVEAMGYDNCVLVNDTPENREVTAEAGLYFSITSRQSLSARMATLVESPSSAQIWRTKARERARAVYSWPSVVDRYQRLFEQLAG